MRLLMVVGFLFTLLSVGCSAETQRTAENPAVAQEDVRETDQAQRSGYVLKRGEGEVIDFDNATWIIKASPQSGTQGGEMHWIAASPGSSTGLHVHLRADEFFYVLSGRGTVVLADQEVSIEPGDVIFVPKGHDHKLENTDSDRPLELLFFLDKPGLADETRALYHRFEETGEPPTLEELNKIANKYGTIYKTLK